MVLKRAILMSGMVVGLMTSTFALADQHEGHGKGPKINFFFKSGLTHDDNGLAKDTKSDSKTTIFSLDAAHIQLSGDIAPKVAYDLRYSFLATGTTPGLDYANVKYEFMPGMKFIAGSDQVLVYGWEMRDGTPIDIYATTGLSSSPFGYHELFGVEYTVAGHQFTLQLPNDDSTNNTWNGTLSDGKVVAGSGSGQAYALEWIGDFGGIMPLVQYASYDFNHSKSYTVGVKANVEALGAVFDYTSHDVGTKGADAAGKAEEHVTTHKLMSLHLSYSLGMMTPYFAYGTYEVDQYKAKGVTKDVTTNTPISGTTTLANAFDDNATTMVLGATFDSWGPGYQPYVNYESVSGKFTSTKDAKETTLTNARMMVGVRGSF